MCRRPCADGVPGDFGFENWAGKNFGVCWWWFCGVGRFWILKAPSVIGSENGVGKLWMVKMDLKNGVGENFRSLFWGFL